MEVTPINLFHISYTNTQLPIVNNLNSISLCITGQMQRFGESSSHHPPEKGKFWEIFLTHLNHNFLSYSSLQSVQAPKTSGAMLGNLPRNQQCLQLIYLNDFQRQCKNYFAFEIKNIRRPFMSFFTICGLSKTSSWILMLLQS